MRQAETVLAQARSDVANLAMIVAQHGNALELPRWRAPLGIEHAARACAS